jgi:hypothetical protein
MNAGFPTEEIFDVLAYQSLPDAPYVLQQVEPSYLCGWAAGGW